MPAHAPNPRARNTADRPMAVDVGPVVGQVPAPGADSFPALPGASTRPGGGVPGDPGDVGGEHPRRGDRDGGAGAAGDRVGRCATRGVCPRLHAACGSAVACTPSRVPASQAPQAACRCRRRGAWPVAVAARPRRQFPGADFCAAQSILARAAVAIDGMAVGAPASPVQPARMARATKVSGWSGPDTPSSTGSSPANWSRAAAGSPSLRSPAD